MNIQEYKEKQLKFFKKYWPILILIGLIGVTFGIIQSIKTDKKAEEYAKIFPYYKTSNQVSGLITHIQESDKRMRNGGGIEFKLNDKKGYTLGWSENKNYSPYKISEFLQIGDSIYKASGTDSVLIYRNGGIYHFEISKRIDKDGNYY